MLFKKIHLSRKRALLVVITCVFVSVLFLLHTYHQTILQKNEQLIHEVETHVDAYTLKDRDKENLQQKLDEYEKQIIADRDKLAVKRILNMELRHEKEAIAKQKNDKKIQEPLGVLNWDNLTHTKSKLLADGLDYEDLVRRGLMGGEPSDETNKQRRQQIKNMMKHAWSSYVTDAWGFNELRPLTRQGQSNGGIFGSAQIGATLIDAMDTLFIMEEYEEVLRCRTWIKENFKENFLKTGHVSVFEITIRFIGGFESMYAFTNDPLYKDMAQFVADQLLVTFTKSPSKLNYPYIDIGKQQPQGYTIPLAIVGTTQLEWAYLSKITNNMIYHNHSLEAMSDILNRYYRIPGLYPRKFYVHDGTGITMYDIGVGGENDSFYEYIFKYWLFAGKGDNKLLEKWLDTQNSIIKVLAQQSRSGLTYLPDMSFSGHTSNAIMEHLSCYVGGLLALSSTVVESNKADALNTGAEITKTCHMSYAATTTHLGAEEFYLVRKKDNERKNSSTQGVLSDFKYGSEMKALQRPEAVESFFYMWRITKEQKYRDWGWEYAKAIEKHYRVDHGYASLEDVNRPGNSPNNRRDEMQSFFLAETLKYLYLLFSDDSLVPLDQYVFNTEAHPLPIFNKGDFPDLPLKDPSDFVT